MKLSNIIKKCKTQTKIKNFYDFEVKGISDKSKNIKEGFIFAAIKGEKNNGEFYISTLSKLKKIAIVVSENFKIKSENSRFIFIKCKDVRKVLSEISSIIFRNNVKHKIAVTGTNGKTSVVHHTRQIWNLIGKNNSAIGTLGIFYNNKKIINSELTTSDSITNHKYLSVLSKKKCENIIFEASSIGLDQHRLFPLKFDKVAFTNLSRDHLDYHKKFEIYKKSKSLLFTNYTKRNSVAVIFADSKYSHYFKDICNKRGLKILDYGKKASFLKIKKIKKINRNFHVTFELNKQNLNFEINVSSEYEILNRICSLLLVFGYKIKKSHFEILNQLNNPPGRLEKIYHKNDLRVYIDYAHTPNALKIVLKSLKKITKGKLILVFGCGGDRDRGKRSIMTKIAVKFSDQVILTNDNPRFEDPKSIIGDMIAEINDDNLKKITKIESRDHAIKNSINIIKPNDILLIAGKGHENYQIIGKKKIPFSDKKIALKYLSKK
ncbi:MAG: UDP-N-acetylmuramoyl-L-alanyl-D-glutamate--2,6-diaminopimelate ligase [Rickettsiales bacterium]|nr:UDP-N-acetylmuramoyl-L-alanyl-D-glutamate--2,6-diaminopimelate ligase [Rickettsiales bacterium]